ncbi:MAG TPA: pyruvate dehydrogenase complex dihydrolipoamide acetyltransferase [Longimicrobiaceae bacterium]|nr:pyruvate dehydrogenase complex dihydrolipoamide acetyltransferase [Longimicrobiaceae bacterium]
MATKVYMEALSPTMEEGRLVTWLKNEGDEVKEGDVLAEVETDKATMELVARGSGLLRKRMIGEGETQAVGSLIAVIAGADEDIAALVGSAGGAQASASEPAKAAETAASWGAAEGGATAQATQAPAAAQPAASASASGGGGEQAAPAAAPEPQAAQGASGPNGRVKASPVARRMAAEAGVEIGGVQGSGPGGRIVTRDVEQAVHGGGQRPAAAEAPAPAQAEAPAAPAPVAAPAGGGYHDLALSPMRKTIAKRLTQSIGPVPHFFLTIEVDMGEALKLRARINERYKDQGIKVSPNDLIVKATAAALRKHPWVNAAWTGDAVRFYDAAHIGIAVAVDEGLITPVVRDADRKGVGEIATEIRELAGRAREKKLKPEEYTGSTFSISNLGMFGIEEFTAVINPPEAAILAVGAIAEKVVVENGEMAIRQRMRVTLSCDHRVIDGATGAQFLQTFKSYLEDPMMMVA